MRQHREPGEATRQRARMALVGSLAGACALALTGALTGSPAGAATAKGPQRCGSLNVPAKPLPGGSGRSSTFHFVHITALGLTCTEAKAVLRGLGYGTVPAGWKLTNGRTYNSPYPLEGILRRGKETITYRYACGGC